MDKHIIALEIGSSAIKLGLARVSPDNPASRPTLCASVILPLGEQVRLGRIFNLNGTAEVIAQGIHTLEASAALAPAKISGVYVAVGGRSLGTTPGAAQLTLPDYGEIDQNILERLHEQACAAIPETKEILQVIPLRYEVDGQPTANPLGSTGEHIAAWYTIVHCDPRNVRNIETVVGQRLGLDICGWVIRPLALAELCLTEKAVKAGCMLADIGHQTTTVAVFKDSHIQYIATLPLGSHLITDDIAEGMGVTRAQAENLKITRGNAVSESLAATTEQIQLDNIVQARAGEIVANISAYVEFAGYRNADLPAGIILTGGGARLRNIGTMLQNSSRMQVRRAVPVHPLSIAETSVSDNDILDLLALIDRAADMARMPDALPSVKGNPAADKTSRTATTAAADRAPRTDRTTPTATHDDRAPRTHHTRHETSDQAPPDQEATFVRDEFTVPAMDDFDDTSWSSPTVPGAHDYQPQEGFDIDEGEDPYLLKDDDEAEAMRRRDELTKSAAREKIRRQEDAQLRRVQRKKEKEQARRKPSFLSEKLKGVKSGIFDLIRGAGEDTDADMDEHIDPGD